MAIKATMTCPDCQAPLRQDSHVGLATFRCPEGHGVAINLQDAYEHLQSDELEAIRLGVASSPVSPRVSPLNGSPMVSVTFEVDNNEDSASDATNLQLTIEVDSKNFIGWFERDELRDMPLLLDERKSRRSGLVGVDNLELAIPHESGVFENLSAEDFEEEPEEEPTGLNSILTGFLQRFRP